MRMLGRRACDLVVAMLDCGGDYVLEAEWLAFGPVAGFRHTGYDTE